MILSGIENGRFWTPQGPVTGDLRIEDGRIAAIGPHECRGVDSSVLDALGYDVLPGAVDLHVHVADRQGPHAIADGFLSGSRAAILGGVTTFVTFATQRPGESVAACVDRFAAEAARDGSFSDWSLHVTPTTWDTAAWADVEALAARGLRTLKIYTTYSDAGLCVDHDRMRDVMARAAALGLTVLVHCEDEGILDRYARSGDPAAARAHPDLRPAAAEIKAARDAIALAGATGCSLHIVHASSPGTVGLVVEGRDHGVSVTCETCPQYLVLDRDMLDQADGHRMLCTPPFRDVADRDMMLQMTMSGHVDVLASDHCPFTRDAKDSGFNDRRRTPMGLPGVGGLLTLGYEMLVEPGAWTWSQLIARIAEAPARVAGLWPRKGALRVGADADLSVVRRGQSPRPVHATLADVYDPWEAIETDLSFRAVVVRGEVVVQDDRVVLDTPTGRCAW